MLSSSLLRRLFLSTAIAGFVATPALSADVGTPVDNSLLFSALLGVSAGIQHASIDEGEPELDEGIELTIAGHGHVSIPLGEAFSAQLDSQGELYDRSTPDTLDPQAAHMFGGHLSWRDPEAGLLGIFAGAGIGYVKEDGGDDDGDGIGVVAGIEGQIYLDNVTLYAQAGWGNIQVDSDPDEGFDDGLFVRGVTRYFVSENFLLQVEGSYGWVDEYTNGDQTGEIWNWGALGKIGLSDLMPIYGTLEYRGGFYGVHGGGAGAQSAFENVLLIGLDFAFGAPSLFDNDRRGATLDMPMLPARAAAWTQTVDSF